MAWIEVHQTLPNHRKTLRLARLLGVSRFEAIGLLITLWTWGLDNADDEGLLSRVTNADVADAVTFNDPQKLCDALCESGYLDRLDDGGLRLHNWDLYAGRLNEMRNEKRKKGRERQKRWRERIQKGASATEYDSNANVTRYARVNNAPTVPNQTVPYIPPIAPQGVEILFHEFWSAYPRKVGKDAAFKAFAKRSPTRELLAAILASIEMQKHSEQWTSAGGKYIPYPATWLNQGRWMDEQQNDAQTVEDFGLHDVSGEL